MAELAPIFFQASLVPYLLFLYFLSYRGNHIPSLANFGFQFVLIFVFGTVVAGILAKTMFASTLANVRLASWQRRVAPNNIQHSHCKYNAPKSLA